MLSGRPLAVVTGASSGIGAAFAERLARDGHDLVLVARREERLRALAERLGREHGAEAEVLVADLVDPEDLERVAARVAGEERLAVLVNNAGFFTMGDFHELDAAREVELVRIHAIPTVRLCHAALGPLLARGGGTIVNVSSRSAFQPLGQLATYAAVKAFVNRFTLGLDEAYRARGVRLLALCPGNTRTEIFENAGFSEAKIATLPMAEPAEVVDLALRDLARGAAVCVPGERASNVWIRRAVPRRVLTRLAGILERLGR